jgi:glutathione peroxidase
MPGFHDFSARAIDGEERALSSYQGVVCLVVNVASKCGLTPQYDGLQRLYDAYRGRGVAVLGFPCNQFAGQEPGSEAEIREFCSANYQVSFPLFAKLDVNGPQRHPLYTWLTQQDAAPEGPGDIKWNFGKFLIDKTGQVTARFGPQTEPQAREVVDAVERALR